MRVHRQMFSSLFAGLLLCSAVLWLCTAPVAWAQSSNSGTVAGAITDPSGALVNGATVTGWRSAAVWAPLWLTLRSS